MCGPGLEEEEEEEETQEDWGVSLAYVLLGGRNLVACWCAALPETGNVQHFTKTNNKEPVTSQQQQQQRKENEHTRLCFLSQKTTKQKQTSKQTNKQANQQTDACISSVTLSLSLSLSLSLFFRLSLTCFSGALFLVLSWLVGLGVQDDADSVRDVEAKRCRAVWFSQCLKLMRLSTKQESRKIGTI